MMGPQKPPPRLHEPPLNETKPAGPKTMTPEELGAAYMQAQIMVPALLDEIKNLIIEQTDALEEISNTASILGLYLKRRGLEEGFLKEADFNEGKDESPVR